MTHHLTRSSISRRNRSRTTPQLTVQPSPIRVKRGARFRVRAPTQLQQYHPQQHHRRASWQHSEDLLVQSPQDKCESFSSILENPTGDASLLPPQHQDIYRLEASTPTSTSDFSSLSVTTTPPTQYGFRSASETDLVPSYPVASNADSFEGDFPWTNSPESELPPAPQCQELQDMSTLGFMLPAHFSSLEPFPPSMDSASILMDPPTSHYLSNSSPQQILPTPSSAPSSTFLPSFPSTPALLGSSPRIPERRHSSSRSTDQSVMPSYQRSPYQAPQANTYQPPLSSSYQPSTSSLKTSPAPLSYGHSSSDSTPNILAATVQPASYSAITANLSSQGLSALSYGSSYPPPPPYVSSSYELSSYHSTHQPLYPPSTASTYPPPYLTASISDATSTSNTTSTTVDGRNVRVVHQRPKPQCWEHGCNGRQFSTFSNLLRHQREKSGTAGKSYCPRCGAEFTRTTAMKGHMNNDKCKPRRTSGASDTASA